MFYRAFLDVNEVKLGIYYQLLIFVLVETFLRILDRLK